MLLAFSVRRLMIALLVPIGYGLVAFLKVAISSDRQINTEMFAVMFLGNALWLAVPHISVLAVTLWKQRLRSHTVSLMWLLNGYLVVFAVWTQLQFSARDAVFVWIIYVPVALVPILGYAAFQRFVENPHAAAQSTDEGLDTAHPIDPLDAARSRRVAPAPPDCAPH